MNKLTKISAATLMFFTVAGQAMAADDNVDVKVTGQIVPPACRPVVSGGAVFDYGVIKAASLAKDDYTVLGTKSLIFSVTCDSPMKVAFKTIDQRAASVLKMPGLNVKVSGIDYAMDDLPKLGLGAPGGKMTGSYVLDVDQNSLQVDDISAGLIKGIQSSDNGASWENVKHGKHLWMDPSHYTSVTLRADGLTPLAFKTLTGTMWVTPALSKGSELDLTKVINLDGLATIQMIYL
ncbi:TPA: DUF1120 domain-containing protein [Klebsiella aerogenes]|nr:DUF1120 domain-containing protein [Klebsiella aerogenes]